MGPGLEPRPTGGHGSPEILDPRDSRDFIVQRILQFIRVLQEILQFIMIPQGILHFLVSPREILQGGP